MDFGFAIWSLAGLGYVVAFLLCLILVSLTSIAFARIFSKSTANNIFYLKVSIPMVVIAFATLISFPNAITFSLFILAIFNCVQFLNTWPHGALTNH